MKLKKLSLDIDMEKEDKDGMVLFDLRVEFQGVQGEFYASKDDSEEYRVHKKLLENIGDTGLKSVLANLKMLIPILVKKAEQIKKRTLN